MIDTLWKGIRIKGKTGCPQADYGLLNQYKKVKLSKLFPFIDSAIKHI